jgi:DNA-binding MarR family transcriptional regulator
VVARNRDIKQIEVCKALHFKRANLVGLIDELEARGLLSRIQKPSDRRSRALRLTKEGERFLARLDAILTERERRLEAKLGEGGKRQLIDLLAKLDPRRWE